MTFLKAISPHKRKKFKYSFFATGMSLQNMRTVDDFKGLLAQHYNFTNYEMKALRGEVIVSWSYNKFLKELGN